MKDGFTRLALVLDRSGSMASIEEATVASVNKFIEEQRLVYERGRRGRMGFVQSGGQRDPARGVGAGNL
jgi:hypothetical protein